MYKSQRGKLNMQRRELPSADNQDFMTDCCLHRFTSPRLHPCSSTRQFEKEFACSKNITAQKLILGKITFSGVTELPHRHESSLTKQLRWSNV